ncbi:DUF1642 domain-containing protein [Listeria seeligeri]|nr:DUF1642 domain-containing protein [Listeria seeligeri]
MKFKEGDKVQFIREGSLIDSYFGYINLNLKTGAYTTSTNEEPVGFKTKFTESEIKNMDTRYWAFAVPVEEVEETK